MYLYEYSLGFEVPRKKCATEKMSLFRIHNLYTGRTTRRKEKIDVSDNQIKNSRDTDRYRLRCEMESQRNKEVNCRKNTGNCVVEDSRLNVT